MYDIIFLALFATLISIFLYINRKNLKKEGLLLLYRTKLGLKIIDYIGGKYQKTLKFLSYVTIGLGYLLLIGAIYLVGKIVWIYIAIPQIVTTLKVPPIMPLIPYIDKIAPGLGLPAFYFTYWIVILAIIAVTHEFAHGIFMKRYNIGIKSTGFGFFPWFFPVFLAAFVEQDEKSMAKKKKFEQMVVLSAGTFANVLTAVFFFIIMWIFFINVFVPSGINFDSYAYSPVEIASITIINGISINNVSYEKILNLTNEEGLNNISSSSQNYLITKQALEVQKDNQGYLALYEDAPAIKNKLDGIITEINNNKIDSVETLSKEIEKYNPGDKITIKTLIEEDSGELQAKEYEIILGENSKAGGQSYLGIGFFSNEREGIMGKIVTTLSSFKDSRVYYETKFNAGLFIYNLLWWIVLISISVALINMLPVGIFDGGRFFYLTILGITKSEKIAEKSFKYITYFFLFVLLALMVFWVKSFF
ncbi:MAG: site-2 protease family protein [bacterium]